MSNKEKYKFFIIYMIPPIVVACIVSAIHFSVNYQNIQTYNAKSFECEFVIVEKNTVDENYSSYVIQLSKVNDKKVNFKANLYIDYKYDSPLYTSCSATLNFSKLKNYSDESSPNFSYLAKGIYLSANTDNITSNNKTVKLFPSYYFQKINITFANIINTYVNGEENALIQALILGNKNQLNTKTKENFRALGLSHMLAVSGMHLSILIGSIGKLVEKLNISKKKRYLLMILITFAYAGITGFSPSVKRAALMLIIFYASFLFSKNHDSITSLCIALFTICIISPNSVFDIGLWLSFLSTYGILQVAVPISLKLNEASENYISFITRCLIKLLSMLLYGIIPVMFSLPILWLSYGEIAILSPLSNILFTPILLGIMYSAPISMVVFFIPLLPSVLFLIPKTFASLMLYFTDLLADYSPLININYNFTKYIVIFFVFSLLILALTNTQKKLLYFVPFIISVAIFCVCYTVNTNNTRDMQKLIFSNTYSGDSFVVISNNKALLCDVSGNSYSSINNSLSIMKENHISQLDGYILTEYNEYAIPTIEKILAKTKIETLYIPSTYLIYEEIYQKEIKEFAKQNKLQTTIYDLSTENQINFFGVEITLEKINHYFNKSDSSVCIAFSGKYSKYHYISKNAHSTTEGMMILVDWFKNENNLLFGSYGSASSSETFPDYLVKNHNLYFADSDTYSLYAKYIDDSSNIKVIDNEHIFYLSKPNT